MRRRHSRQRVRNDVLLRLRVVHVLELLVDGLGDERVELRAAAVQENVPVLDDGRPERPAERHYPLFLLLIVRVEPAGDKEPHRAVVVSRITEARLPKWSIVNNRPDDTTGRDPAGCADVATVATSEARSTLGLTVSRFHERGADGSTLFGSLQPMMRPRPAARRDAGADRSFTPSGRPAARRAVTADPEILLTQGQPTGMYSFTYLLAANGHSVHPARAGR